MKRSEATPKFNKKRGYYFRNAIDVPYSQKYKISSAAISDIRRFAIFRKMSQSDIVFYITNRLNNGDYDKDAHGKKVKRIREEICRFLVSSSPENFQDITHKTKFDYED